MAPTQRIVPRAISGNVPEDRIAPHDGAPRPEQHGEHEQELGVVEQKNVETTDGGVHDGFAEDWTKMLVPDATIGSIKQPKTAGESWFAMGREQ